MSLEQFKNRNVDASYVKIELEDVPSTTWEKFSRVVKRALKGELFVGLFIVCREMFRFNIHTVQYPKEKLPIGPRYRAVHKLMRFIESGNERCIGCGLCEKICIANCIRMDTHIGDDRRKKISEYTINLGRCIFCGYCAEVCPELAIVHGQRYENASEQRAHFVLKDDMLTPIDLLKRGEQKEFPGFGALPDNADELVKQSPSAFAIKKEEK